MTGTETETGTTTTDTSGSVPGGRDEESKSTWVREVRAEAIVVATVYEPGMSGRSGIGRNMDGVVESSWRLGWEEELAMTVSRRRCGVE